MSDERLHITFGGMAPKIAEQLREQGRAITDEDAELIQRLADAVQLLLTHGALTHPEVTRARRRLMRMIGEMLE